MKYNILVIFCLACFGFAKAVAKPEDTIKPDEAEANCPVTSKEENTKIATAFLQKVLNEQNIDLIDELFAPDYITHNPGFANGVEALKAGLAPFVTPAGQPIEDIVEIVRSVAQDDMVWIHFKNKINNKPVAIVDIFRIKCGKIVELWDVIQEMIPSEVNDHAYF